MNLVAHTLQENSLVCGKDITFGYTNLPSTEVIPEYTRTSLFVISRSYSSNNSNIPFLKPLKFRNVSEWAIWLNSSNMSFFFIPECDGGECRLVLAAGNRYFRNRFINKVVLLHSRNKTLKRTQYLPFYWYLMYIVSHNLPGVVVFDRNFTRWL